MDQNFEANWNTWSFPGGKRKLSIVPLAVIPGHHRWSKRPNRKTIAGQVQFQTEKNGVLYIFTLGLFLQFFEVCDPWCNLACPRTLRIKHHEPASTTRFPRVAAMKLRAGEANTIGKKTFSLQNKREPQPRICDLGLFGWNLANGGSVLMTQNKRYIHKYKWWDLAWYTKQDPVYICKYILKYLQCADMTAFTFSTNIKYPHTHTLNHLHL